jgi:hypothetical protein
LPRRSLLIPEAAYWAQRGYLRLLMNQTADPTNRVPNPGIKTVIEPITADAAFDDCRTH